jgi:hypothetical protein
MKQFSLGGATSAEDKKQSSALLQRFKKHQPLNPTTQGSTILAPTAASDITKEIVHKTKAWKTSVQSVSQMTSATDISKQGTEDQSEMIKKRLKEVSGQ